MAPEVRYPMWIWTGQYGPLLNPGCKILSAPYASPYGALNKGTHMGMSLMGSALTVDITSLTVAVYTKCKENLFKFT